MEVQGMEMHHGGLIHPKVQEIMGVVRPMVLMVDKVAMVVGMVLHRADKLNSSDPIA